MPIFDEGTSNLDQATAEQFAKTVNLLRGQVTMLFTTHRVPGLVRALLWICGAWLLAWQAPGLATSRPVSAMDAPGGYLFTQDMAGKRTQEQRGIVWLDNNRIMFQGHLPMEHRQQGDVGVYIWDIEHREVSRYGHERHFCYADGFVYLSELSRWDRRPQESGPKRFTKRYRHGPLYQEKIGVCTGDGEGHTEGCVGDIGMSCKPVAYPRGATPLGLESLIEVYLRSGDGFLVASPSRRQLKAGTRTYDELVRLTREPILLINERYPRGKPLPIQEVEEISMRVTAYSEYAQQYVLIGSNPKNSSPGMHSNWPTGMPQPVYLMARDGGVEIVEVPKLNDWANIHQAMPSRHGLVYWGSHGRTGGGIFIYEHSRNEALDRGQVATFAVSHDGCKVAYAIINSYNRGPSPTLDYRIKYVDLCQGD